MFVGGCGVTAAWAGEFRLGDAILACCVSAVLAAIGGVAGVDLNPDTPSVFRFCAQYFEELAPASVTDTPTEPGLRPGAVGQELPVLVGVGDGFGPAHHVGDR